VGAEHAVPLRVGWTPLYSCPILAAELELSAVWVKDDGLNPTASYKDRATAVAVAAAKKLGKTALTCASTGNAATSLAGFCASAGLPCYIFVPRTAPRPKIAQLIAFGAMVFAVDGTYDEAFDLCAAAAARFGWYNRSAAVNPMNVEGKKTGAIEIWEELRGDVPDFALVAVGDGSVISGICKGFSELVRLGLVDRVPRVYGVQAEGAAAVAHAFARYMEGGPILPADERAETSADSIRVGRPRDVLKAVKYVAETGGGFVTVTDSEIVTAAHELSRRVGVFAEPAAAAPYAGLLNLLRDGTIPVESKVVLFVTGSGLKDPEGVLCGLADPLVIPPRLEAVEEVVGR
jgi:threonine synthase